MDNNQFKKIKNRHFYNNADYKLDETNCVIELTKAFHEKLLNKTVWGSLGLGYKKITGTAAGDVLKVGPFSSEFKAFARMCYLDIPPLDKKYLTAGINIEPKIISSLEKQKNVKSIKTFPAVENKYDYFSNVEIIGGLPDGLVEFNDGQKMVIEIKTTAAKNRDNWNKYGIPANYIKQVELYAYLMGIEKLAIVAAFLEPEDYENSKTMTLKHGQIKTWFMSLHKERTNDDIEKIRTWYKKYTKLGISPKYDIRKDSALIEYLRCSTKEEWIALLDKWDKLGKINWESFNE